MAKQYQTPEVPVDNSSKKSRKAGEKNLSSLPETDKTVLAAVRKSRCETAAKVAERSKLIPTTATSSLNRLIDKKMILKDDNGFFINQDYGYFMGVSIGSAHVSVTILDFAFNFITLDKVRDHLKKDSVFAPDSPDPENFWTSHYFRPVVETEDCPDFLYPKAYDPYALWRADMPTDVTPDIPELVSSLCLFAVELKENGLNILSAGFAFPGHVDRQKTRIIKSRKKNFSIENKGVEDLLFINVSEQIERQNISICFDNHSSCCALAELNSRFGCMRDKNGNSAIMYLGGSGFGLALYLDHKLIRGKTGLVGTDWGHTPIKFGNFTKEEECYCGKFGCFEKKIRLLFREENTDKDGKGDSVNDDFIRTHTGSQIAAFLNEPGNGRIKSKFIDYIWRAIWPKVSILEIEHLIWTGKLSELYKGIEDQFMAKLWGTEHAPTSLVSQLGRYSSVTGAAINGFFFLIKQ